MKSVFRLLFALIFMVSVGCAPKMRISYETDNDSYSKKDICNKKIGILKLNDKRVERDRDRFFEKPATEVVRGLLVSKFNAHCGDSVTPVEKASLELNDSLMTALSDTSHFDYLLVGSLNSFSSNYKDKNSGLRITGSVISGLTFPIGLIIFPFVMIGDVDQVTDIQIDNITLIDARSKQVLWRGKANKQLNEEIPFVNAGIKTNEDRYNIYGKEVVDNIFHNISLSHDMGFPNKLTIENSKIMISYMSESGSAGVIEY